MTGTGAKPPEEPIAFHAEGISEALRRAVEKHLVSDVPVGVFLSGGLDSSLLAALRRSQVDELHSFTVGLEDDRGAIPPYDAVILAGPRLVRDRPDAIAALRQLAGTIDADRMRRMNFAVDENGADPATVAEAFRPDLRTTKGNQGIQQ